MTDGVIGDSKKSDERKDVTLIAVGVPGGVMVGVVLGITLTLVVAVTKRKRTPKSTRGK